MRTVLLTFVAVAGTLLDLTVFGELRLWGGHPSACAALIATWSVLRRREDVMVLVPLCGLGLGILGNEPIGASLIGMAVIAFLGWSRAPEGAEGKFIHAMGVTITGTPIAVAILALVVGAADRALPDPVLLAKSMAGATILTVPLAAMLYLPLARTVEQPRSWGLYRRG